MSPCHSAFHPQVPITLVSVGIKWCHQCAAWQIIRGVATTYGDDDITLETYDNVEFGPFDTIEDVLRDACVAIVDLMARPGRPWVR